MIVRPTSRRNGTKSASAHITPKTLKSVWAIAARRAFALPTAAAMLAVMVVPIFSPSTIAAPISNGIQPIFTIMSVSAIVADDDCNTRVSTVPRSRKISTEPKP